MAQHASSCFRITEFPHLDGNIHSFYYLKTLLKMINKKININSSNQRCASKMPTNDSQMPNHIHFLKRNWILLIGNDQKCLKYNAFLCILLLHPSTNSWVLIWINLLKHQNHSYTGRQDNPGSCKISVVIGLNLTVLKLSSVHPFSIMGDFMRGSEAGTIVYIKGNIYLNWYCFS